MIKRQSLFKISLTKQRKDGESPRCYQEGLIGTLAEGWVVWTVDRCLTGELRVKLTHVFSWLLHRQTKGEEERQHEQMCKLTTRRCETREDLGSTTETYSVALILTQTADFNIYHSYISSQTSLCSAPLTLTRKGLKGGSTFRASKSSQLMCRKKGWVYGKSKANRV